jgi:hypothetical protein
MNHQGQSNSQAKPVFRVLAGIMAMVCLVAAICSAFATFSGSEKHSWFSVIEMLGGAAVFGAIAIRGRRKFFD